MILLFRKLVASSGDTQYSKIHNCSILYKKEPPGRLYRTCEGSIFPEEVKWNAFNYDLDREGTEPATADTSIRAAQTYPQGARTEVFVRYVRLRHLNLY